MSEVVPSRNPWRAVLAHPLRPGYGTRAPRRPRPQIDGDQLELDIFEPARGTSESLQAAARRQLIEQLASSGLSHSDFARWVLGRAPRTVTRYLAGAPIPRDAARWLRDLEAIELRGDHVVLILRRGAIGPRWSSLLERRQRVR